MAEHDLEQLVGALRGGSVEILADRSVRDLDDTVRRLLRVAIAMVPGALGAGLIAWEEGAARSLGALPGGIGHLDRLQVEGGGPAADVVDDPPSLGAVSADLAGEDHERWPRLAAAAGDAGYPAAMAVHLAVPDHVRVLTLYGAGTFTDRDRTVAALYGLQAAAALHGAEHVAQLGRALESRDVIGQAKGVLRERFGIDDGAAFEMLVSSSQSTNIKLADVARWLLEETAVRGGSDATRRPDG
ncbi:ANTAR domain-containing protein [Actinomycetospora sp. OC33-EN08]|uniref:ANTAR domain-containing protein n=1 Tax=Actinomycetospora aurantiaca TaxID=3129233 RepID=A0ABU8MQN5_9PSEU